MAHIPVRNDSDELIHIREPEQGHNSTLMTRMLDSREDGKDLKGPQKARSSPKGPREWAEEALFMNLSRFRSLNSITFILSYENWVNGFQISIFPP